MRPKQRNDLKLNHSCKMLLMKYFFWSLLTSLLFYSCDTDELNIGNQQAYVPIYAQPGDLTNIGAEAVRTTSRPGKVYVLGNLLLQNDINTGVHFIDISDKANPKKVSFLRVPWSTEVSVKDGYLYVNNFNDLLVFNISDISNPVLIKRLADVFPYHNSEYPPDANAYFECVDHSKGIVVGWELKTVTNPKCRR